MNSLSLRFHTWCDKAGDWCCWRDSRILRQRNCSNCNPQIRLWTFTSSSGACQFSQWDRKQSVAATHLFMYVILVRRPEDQRNLLNYFGKLKDSSALAQESLKETSTSLKSAASEMRQIRTWFENKRDEKTSPFINCTEIFCLFVKRLTLISTQQMKN